MTRLEPSKVIDFASVARARKARFIIRALGEYCEKYEPHGKRALLDVAKDVAKNIESRAIVDTMAHRLMGTKKPTLSSETTWAMVISELEARQDAVHDAAVNAEDSK